MDHVSLVTWTIFRKPPLRGRPNKRPGDHGTPDAHNRCLILSNFIMHEDPLEYKLIEIAFGWGPGHLWPHTRLEGPWPYYMILEVCWDSRGTLCFGLSQCHGHGSRLVCEVALSFLAREEHYCQDCIDLQIEINVELIVPFCHKTVASSSREDFGHNNRLRSS